jgi:hypothetical protein
VYQITRKPSQKNNGVDFVGHNYIIDKAGGDMNKNVKLKPKLIINQVPKL